mmetsp:Transcript_138879/g.241634  ORF Transcript_138879/g.241634 Transcript_138879/m.241634 type:complete len:217 (-) Transcript_138879:108-758(-)
MCGASPFARTGVNDSLMFAGLGLFRSDGDNASLGPPSKAMTAPSPPLIMTFPFFKKSVIILARPTVFTLSIINTALPALGTKTSAQSIISRMFSVLGVIPRYVIFNSRTSHPILMKCRICRYFQSVESYEAAPMYNTFGLGVPTISTTMSKVVGPASGQNDPQITSLGKPGPDMEDHALTPRIPAIALPALEPPPEPSLNLSPTPASESPLELLKL